MKNFLLIGGLGFVGKNLSSMLCSQNNTVKIIDIKQPSKYEEDFLNRNNIDYIQGNIIDESFTSREIINGDFDGVYHLASFVGIKNYISNPSEVILTTIQGTLNVARACIEANSHMLFTSTSEVLGKNPDTPWTEDADRVYGSTTVDRWSYGSSKGVAEQLIIGLSKSTDLSFTIIRFFNIYGSHQNPIFVVPKTIHNILNGKKPLVYDGGNQTRCFTYVEDAVTAVDRLMKKKASGIYHIGSNFEYTIAEAIDVISKVATFEQKVKKINTNDLYGNTYEDILRRVPDVSKIEHEIDWVAKTNLDEGVAKTIEWVKKNDWWLELNASVESF